MYEPSPRLQRSNYTEPKDRLPGIIDDDDEDGDRTGTGRPVHRARDTLNLRNDGKQKRKSTAAVRQILLYRKTFNTLLEESVSTDYLRTHFNVQILTRLMG